MEARDAALLKQSAGLVLAFMAGSFLCGLLVQSRHLTIGLRMYGYVLWCARRRTRVYTITNHGSHAVL